MAKFCTNCGSPVADGTAFCTSCGAPVPQEVKPQSADGGQQGYGGYNPSVASGDSSPYTGEPAGGQQYPQGDPAQPYGQQGYGDTSSVTPVPGATPSPQGEGGPYVRQPYGQQGYGGYNPSVASGDSSPYTGEPAGGQQYPQGDPAQPYGQQGYGDTSSVTPVPGATPSPQGEGGPYVQQPYGQQPAGNVNAVYGGQPYGYPQQPKKSGKGLVIGVIALLLVLGLAAVAAFVWPGFLNGKSSALDGEWLGEYGETMTIGDGRLTINQSGYNETVYDMKLDGDNIEITQIVEATFKIEGDTLTITTPGAGGRSDIFAERVSGSAGIEGEWNVLRVVDEDGDADDIDGVTMEFKSDGAFISRESYSDVINGEYKVSGDKITLRYTSDRISFVYTIEGDTLTFWEKDDDGELEKVETFTRKGASGGSGSGSETASAIVGRWENEYGYLFVLNADGTGYASADGESESFTYTVEGDKLVLVTDGETNSYTYKLEGDILTVYYDNGEVDEVFYREGSDRPVTPASRYTGASVVGKWEFDISGVDYSDMYDAMMGDAYDTSGVSETAKRIMQDAQYKEALREPITDVMKDYELDFRSDGSVYITVDTDDYVSFMAKSTEAMIPLLRALTIEEAADYYGMTVAELEQYLASNGMTWDQQVDGIAATYSEVNSEFDEYSVAEVLGGTLNAYGDVELYAGSFTQNGDRVTMTGSGGGVTVFVFDDDDTLLLDGISGSGSEMAMFCAMEGLKFVR